MALPSIKNKIVDGFGHVSGFVRKHLLLVVLVSLLVLLYIKYYITPSRDLEILQLSLEKLDVGHLLEKKPIVLTERLANPLGLLDTVFKYLAVRNRSWIVYNKSYLPFQQNKHRFMVIYASSACELQLVHPRFYLNGFPSDIVYMTLKKRQTVIIPMFWWYSIKGHAFSMEVDTLFSLVYSTVL